MPLPTADPFHDDPANWRYGVFYFCRADRRIIVPKRLRGFGWTLNFARPFAVPFMILLLASVFGLVELARSFGVGSEARFALKLFLLLGIVVLCHWLSKRPAQIPPAAPGEPKLP